MGITLFSRREILSAASIFAGGYALQLQADEPPAGRKRFAIAIHGGAGKSPKGDEAPAVEKSLAEALGIGEKILKEGGTSLDAVEQVIRFLEDDPLFNAGRGAVFNAAGGHELDASIMDGKTKACGAVAAVRTIRHPISLSRLVMEKTRHVLLASDGAEQFADEMKVERVENSWFDTERQRKNWEKEKAEAAKQSGTGRSPLASEHLGTVGCVALDTHGNLAAGTSTGGLTNKKYGRVGDSPIVGAGTYADNATCAVSCTGIGEQFIRHAVAYDVSARMAYLKQPLKEAVAEILAKKLRPNDGGIIAVGADGTIAMDFSTAGMARAAADSSGRREVKIGR
ncbi:MAG: isoaspartyl peptidase/L-asparaginase [Planctomycetaceae bacterium]|nr:isoaspartyl peptidase/L-asparaginase [Planctomycetaceae bacterium]